MANRDVITSGDVRSITAKLGIELKMLMAVLSLYLPTCDLRMNGRNNIERGILSLLDLCLSAFKLDDITFDDKDEK